MNNSRAAATARLAELRGVAMLSMLSLQEKQIRARAAERQLLWQTPPNGERGKDVLFPLILSLLQSLSCKSVDTTFRGQPSTKIRAKQRARHPGANHNKTVNPSSYHVVSLILLCVLSILPVDTFQIVFHLLLFYLTHCPAKICVNSILIKQASNHILRIIVINI